MEELGISDHRQDYWFMELDGFMLCNDLCPPEGVLITELKVVRSHRIYEYDVHGFQIGSHEVLLPLLFRQLFLPLPLVQLRQQFHGRIAEVLSSFNVDSSHHDEIIEHILSFASTTAGMAMAGEERRVLRIFPLLHIFTSESVVVLGHDPDQEESELLLRSESEDEGVVNRGAPEHVVRELRELHGFRANKNPEGGRLGICPICLDDMVADEDEEEATQLIQMPCSDSHVFHDQCIVMWLRTRNSCPLCRFAIC